MIESGALEVPGYITLHRVIVYRNQFDTGGAEVDGADRQGETSRSEEASCSKCPSSV